MSYLTFEALTKSTRFKAFNKATIVNESLGRSQRVSKNVFLSYRHKDKDYVTRVIEFLEKFDINIYVDYLDETLDDKTIESIAVELRTRISGCTKFISLSTPNSGNSKWMPWELGLGDRIVNYKNVAMLPLTNNEYMWTDQEYGNIYGKIESRYSQSNSDINDWMVKYPDGTTIGFSQWLGN